MSATGRGAEREDEDYYPTPSWTVRRLLEAWQPKPGSWLEPGAGGGAIIRAVDAATLVKHDWIGVEIREEERETLTPLCKVVQIGDFLHGDDRYMPPFIVSTVIGNPPFRFAAEFIWKARMLCPIADIAFLLRLNFAASDERADFMRQTPPDVYVLPNRPSFTGEGTDSPEYAWFVWPPVAARARGGFQVLNTTPIAERKLDKGWGRVVVDPQLGLNL
jgi:hypothetical protein